MPRRLRAGVTVACIAIVALAVSVLTLRQSDDRSVVNAPATTTGPESSLPGPAVADVSSTVTPPTVGASVAVGSSVMVGAADQLVKRGFVVDAVESRSFADIAVSVDGLLEAGSLGEVVVIEGGVNGPIDRDGLGALMTQLAGIDRVVFVTGTGSRPWTSANNEILRSLPAEHSNVVIADWAVDGAQCPGDCFFDDGLHLRPDGRAHYADVVGDAADRDFGDIPRIQACPPVDRVAWSDATSPAHAGPLSLQALTVRSVRTAMGDIALFARTPSGTVRSSCQPAATYQHSLDSGLGFFDVGTVEGAVVLLVAYPSHLATGVHDIGLGEPAASFTGNGLTTVVYVVTDDVDTGRLPTSTAMAIDTARSGTSAAGGFNVPS